MNAFEHQPSPAEVLKTKLTQLNTRADELRVLIARSGENIDVELGSEKYIDHGYTEELREILLETKNVEAELQNIDDQAATQRNLQI